MKSTKIRRSRFAAYFTAPLAALLLVSTLAGADDNEKKPAAKPAAKTPAAKKPATGATKGATPAATPAGRGPAAGAAPAAGRGTAATPGAGRGATPAAATGRAGTTPAAAGRAGAPGTPARGNTVGGHVQPRGVNTVRAANGNEFSRRADGRPRDVHVAGRGMDIHHGLGGERRIAVERADHSRIVAERGRGFVDHPYMFRGHEFAHRTYVVNGRVYDRFYGRYEYRPGVFIAVYAPVRYYPVGFYGWAYNPWVAPVPYAWVGWAGAPWYAYYGPFFAPYPVYANASLWLTDYLISQSLIASYQAQAAAAAANQPPPPLPAGQVALTPDVKQAIADEVRRQVALENAEAQANAQNADFSGQSSGIARMLADNMPHTFVAGTNLDLIDASGQECAVSEGDVLQLATPPPPTAQSANLIVMASKGGVECRRGNVVSVNFPDLQDMQNHMRETIDEGMGTLQTHPGGLPTPPPSAMAMATPAAFSAGAPPPDQTAAAQINQQLQDADKAEQETLAQAPAQAPLAPIAPPAAPAGPPPTVSLGQSPDQVTGILGQPKSIMDLGARKIYVYPSLKVTFKDGKVSDIE
jgi:hypothetical protein